MLGSQKKWLVAGGVLVILMLFGAIVFRSFIRDVQIIRIGGLEFRVEVANTPALRERGLGLRMELDPDSGMIFLFPDMSPGPYAFWMKDMRFPIDIAWIRSGHVFFIERNIPADSASIFHPPGDADMVLEVNASKLMDVSVGDSVELFLR